MVSSGRLVGPDKTGHFRTLLGCGAWVGVSDARGSESTAEAKRRDSASTLGSLVPPVRALAALEGRHAAAILTLVWDARVAESIMMLFLWVRGWDTGSFLATHERSTSETCSTVRGRDAGLSPAGDPRWMAWAGRREAGEDASPYCWAIHVGWPCVSVGAEPCKRLEAASVFVRLVQQSSPFLFSREDF